MRSSATALAALALAAVGSAYEGTVPILAWSSHDLPALASLSPSHPANQPNSPFRQSAQAPLAANVESTSSLCSLSSVVLLSAPGLHYSDLSLLAPGSSLEALASSTQPTNQVSYPYVDARKAVANGPVDKFVQRFVQECGAVVEREGGQKHFWAGEDGGKRVRVEVVEGLDEWQLTGKVAREGRKEIVQQIDAALAGHLAATPGPFVVILTSLPEVKSSGCHHNGNKNQKRQYDDTALSAESESELEQIEDLIAEFATSLWEEDATASAAAAAANGTSIFAPAKNSGLFHRYVFFTPGLILCLVISFLVLTPVAIIGTKSLGTIHTLAGLETKMAGSVGGEAAKAQ